MALKRRDHTNREGNSDFDVKWQDARPGAGTFTAVLRVKNEAASLPWVLPGLFRAVEAVVLIDNGSDDGTPDIAQQVAKEQDAQDQLRVLYYPFSVGRCGPEHRGIPTDSITSLTYYYNWAFSQVDTRYGLKWDGDMVLTEQGERRIKHLQWQLADVERIVKIPRYPVYVESDRVAYLDVSVRNSEPWAWPNRDEYFHGKALDWELPLWPEETEYLVLPEWTCFELKWLDSDEFSHWTPETDFTAQRRTGRKAREEAVFEAVKGGAMPKGVHRIEAPEGTHVIDLLRRPESAEYVRGA